jgi:hypothetical protein
MLTTLISLGLCLFTASRAHSKGYNGVLWFFGGGLLALVTLAFLFLARSGQAQGQV